MPRARHRLRRLQPLGVWILASRFKSASELREGDFRRNNPRFQGENFLRNLDLLQKIEEVAREKKCTPAQLALAWLLSRGEDIVPILGTKKRAYLEENVAAVEIRLSAALMDRLDAVIPAGAASGDRYPEAGMHTVNR